MFGKIKDIFRKNKNRVVASAAAAMGNKALNREMPGIGTIENIEIDSINKNVSFDLKLKGETDSIILQIQGYKITESEGKKYLSWNKIIVSKPWITLLINRYAPKENIIQINGTIAWLAELLV